jgi:hypothetical protein
MVTGLTALMAFPVSYLASVLFGWPLIGFLERKRRLYASNLLIGGAVFGAATFYLFGFGLAALLESTKLIAPSLGELLFGAVLGLLLALSYCLIAGISFSKRHHPREQ